MAEKTAKEKTIHATYGEIQRCDQNGDYERALKAANRILQLAPNEQLAFHCKIVCFIHLSKFDEAVQLLNKNQELAKILKLEKAYCYYRLNKYNEALKIAEQGSDDDIKLMELKAQILYRLEDYKKSVDLYHQIIKNSADDFEDEHQTNLSASYVFMPKDVVEKELNDVRETTYELCFNKACMLIAVEEYAEAEKKLKKCEKLYRESLEEEEMTDEEVDVDLALILAQLAFVYQKQGRIKEAHEMYTDILKKKLDDSALTVVASNNVACINKDQNIFDSKKKMKMASNEQLISKIPTSTRKYIAANNAIFLYYANSLDLCNRQCLTLQKSYPEFTTTAKVLSALTLVKADKIQAAIDALAQYHPEKPVEKLYVNLCRVQWLLMLGQREKACALLESMGDDTYKPGVIGALITLYLSLGKQDLALKVFEKAVEWYRKNKVKGDLSEMWRQAADFHIRNGQTTVAVHCLEELLKINPKDMKSVALIVTLLSPMDVKRAIKYSDGLPSVEDMVKGVDVESLENFGSLIGKKAPTKQDSQSGTPMVETTPMVKRKQKKRKAKLPKNYDPNVQPDPERWLPKYERAGFRKKRDRRAKEVIKGSQGTSTGQSEQFDFSGKIDYSPGDTHVSATEAVSPPAGRHQHKKGQQKKKSKRR